MRNAQSLERLVARQLGVVAVWQITALGLASSTFIAYAHRHGWNRLDRGVWAAPWSVESFARRCVIARISGPRARLITGGSQLVLLGVRRAEPSAVDVWVGPKTSLARRPGLIVHRGAWLSGDRAHRVQGIPCTPVLRSLRDAAPRSSVDRLVRDIAQIDRLRLSTPEQVAADLDRSGPFRGKPKLAAAAALACEGLVHSRDEEAARQLLMAEDFVLHPRPLAIHRRTRLIAEIDIAVCAVRYGIEVDGPTHLADGAADWDIARDQRLRRLGWEIDRFPIELIRDDPEGFLAAVRLGFEKASRRGVEPWPCIRC
jgi:hypothetical protein